VDTGLDQNQAELGVLVLAVALKVLADGNSLGYMLASRDLPTSQLFPPDGPLTFLISMYRSSGISGARPVLSLCQP
jgi:hypothetical protein